MHQWFAAIAIAAGIAGLVAWAWTEDWRWVITGLGAFIGLAIAGGMAVPNREDTK